MHELTLDAEEKLYIPVVELSYDELIHGFVQKQQAGLELWAHQLTIETQQTFLQEFLQDGGFGDFDYDIELQKVDDCILWRCTESERPKFWYPTAADLPLLDIPEASRPQLRKRLAPWLLNLKTVWGDKPLGVRAGNCWETAQSLVRAANDPDVTLVEGVWLRPWQLEDGEVPAPHSWAKVDGHRVDLIGEFYAWKDEDAEWLYEPLKEYTCAEVIAFNNDTEPGNSISMWRASDEEMEKFSHEIDAQLPAHLRWEQAPEESAAHDKFAVEYEEHLVNIVFKPAVDRLLQRHTERRNRPPQEAQAATRVAIVDKQAIEVTA